MVFDRLTQQVVVGNHRVKAAILAAMPEIPVIYITADNPQHARRILISDNRISDLADNNPAELLEMLAELRDAGGGLDGTGYTEADYVQLLEELGDEAFVEGLTDEDAVPDLPAEKKVVSRSGDIWQLGPHRIGCGSSTDPAHLQAVMQGRLAKLCWTDPPYNVDYEGKTKDRLKIANDAMTPAEFGIFMRAAVKTFGDCLAAGACFYIAYAELEAENFYGSVREAGLKYSQTRIWVKNAGVLSRQDYNWQHEPIIYGWKPGAAHYFCGDFTLTTVLNDSPDFKKLSKDELVRVLEDLRDMASTVIYADKPARNDLHPTMKPVSLVERMLLASSRPHDLVIDPFGGSGSTLIAAHKTNRVCCTNDLDPRYVDVMVERLQAFSGLSATRQDGQHYDDLKRQVYL